MASPQCYCGSSRELSDCCCVYISGAGKAPMAEALMRLRYSAYVIRNADYLWETTAPKMRKRHSKAAMLQWAKANHWLKLEIISVLDTVVEFKAYYPDERLQPRVHHEKSTFMNEGRRWYYHNGEYE